MYSYRYRRIQCPSFAQPHPIVQLRSSSQLRNTVQRFGYFGSIIFVLYTASELFAPDFIPSRPHNDHKVGDDTNVYELFGPIYTNTSRDSESDYSQVTCCPCRNSLTGTVRLGRPRKTRSTSSVKQVALVSFTRSLRRTPVRKPSVPGTSPRDAPFKSLGRPAQPITPIEASVQINPHATSPNTQTTEAITPTTRPNLRRIEWQRDSDAPRTESGGELILSTETAPSLRDRISLRILPPRFRPDCRIPLMHNRNQHY